MSASLSQFSDGDRVFLALGETLSSQALPELWSYLPEDRQHALQNLSTAWQAQQSETEIEEGTATAQELLLFPKKRSLVYEAEGSWIAEKLSAEDPALISVVLARLPKARMGQVLRCLPKETRRSLKNIQVAKIPQSLQTWLVSRAEASFPQIDWSNLLSEDLFRQLMDLDWKASQALLRELGLSELSLALGKMARSSLRAILHRLSPKDAKEIKGRIQNEVDEASQDQRQAQLRLLAVDLEKPQAHELIEEIGLSCFARLFHRSDREAVELFVHRFPLKQGYALKRYFNEYRQASSDEALPAIRRKVLLALAQSALVKE